MNFYFYLVLPFYFLKWNHYFSACENLSNSSCHFWKHKSIFLQILHHYSVPSNITLLHFLSQKYTLVKSSQLKWKFFRFSGAQVKLLLMSILNWHINSSSNLASFSWPWKITPPYFFTLNIIYFGQKRPIKVQNFDTFKCSSQNLSNSLYQFWNDKWIPLQILHHSPLSWKRTPLYFLPQTLHILVKSSPLKCKFFSFLIARLEIYQIPYVNFELTSQFFFKSCFILHCHDT